MTIHLFSDNDKQLHKRIAALLVKIFVEVEMDQFERRLSKVLPILVAELDVNKFKEVFFFDIIKHFDRPFIFFKYFYLILEH